MIEPAAGLPSLSELRWLLFDWGDTLMVDHPGEQGPMWQWPRVEAVADACELLAALSTRVKIGLTSNACDSDETAIRRALERVGLAPFIGPLFCRNRLAMTKNEPLFWHQVVAELAVPPATILHIGDQWQSDVERPRAGRLQALWFGHSDPGGAAGERRWSHKELRQGWRL